MPVRVAQSESAIISSRLEQRLKHPDMKQAQCTRCDEGCVSSPNKTVLSVIAAARAVVS